MFRGFLIGWQLLVTIHFSCQVLPQRIESTIEEMKAGNYEKLNDKNYPTWEVNVRGLLKMKGCWRVVRNPLPASDKRTPEIEMQNDKAEGVILMSIDKSTAKEIKDCRSAYECGRN